MNGRLHVMQTFDGRFAFCTVFPFLSFIAKTKVDRTLEVAEVLIRRVADVLI